MADYYSTRDVCNILGVSRQTLANWGAVPDAKGIGPTGPLMWTAATIAALAEEHGRTIDLAPF